jgi:hypothetical protein
MDKKKEIKPALVGNAAVFSVLVEQSINILCPATTRRLLHHALSSSSSSSFSSSSSSHTWKDGSSFYCLSFFLLLLAVTHFRLEKLFRMLARTGGLTTLD